MSAPLSERSETAILQQVSGEFDEEDGRSDTSSRSDGSEEAAGLVSRLSDEADRANRRAKYEGGVGGRAGTSTAIGGPSYRESEDSERGTGVSNGSHKRKDTLDGEAEGRLSSSSLAERTGNERDHSIAPSDVRDGVFRDRAADTQRTRRGKGRSGTMARVWEISREALPTLLLSLISLMLSGELLIHLSKWPVFSKVDKLFILIPILLNLKGNLEGNLSLRMSTSANIGELDVRRTRETLIFGNLALLQVQALIVSLFAGILSFLLGLGTGTEAAKQPPTASVAARLVPRRVIHHHPSLDPSLKMRNGYFEFVLVIATAMLSASISSAILGTFMCALVVVTRQRGGNPDNIASPLSGSLGDLLTLTLLGLLSSFMVRFEGTILATMILLGLVFVCLAFFMIAYRNAYVRELLSSGWIPLVVAMFISSGAGVVLDTFVSKFEGFALLVPVITGLPGACAAIFVSRTSTALHGGHGVNRPTSGRSFRRGSLHRPATGLMGFVARYTPRWLAGLGGPTEGWTVPSTIFSLGLLVVTSFIAFVRLTGQMSFGLPFFFALIIAGIMQLACSLAIAHVLTLVLWRYDYDPDIYCLPYVSSLVDVIGQVILVIAYYMAIGLGDTITAAVNDGRK